MTYLKWKSNSNSWNFIVHSVKTAKWLWKIDKWRVLKTLFSHNGLCTPNELSPKITAPHHMIDLTRHMFRDAKWKTDGIIHCIFGKVPTESELFMKLLTKSISDHKCKQQILDDRQWKIKRLVREREWGKDAEKEREKLPLGNVAFFFGPLFDFHAISPFYL